MKIHYRVGARRCCWRRDRASVWRGRGKDVATVVGALGGGYAGTRSRALSRKAILTRLRNSVVNGV